jgi:hypothetical protein
MEVKKKIYLLNIIRIPQFKLEVAGMKWFDNILKEFWLELLM